MLKIILLGTSGCHLCEQAELIVAQCKLMDVETIDIAEHEHWQEKYAIRIPVLYHLETQKELGWPFTQEQVQVFVDELIK